MVNIYNQDFACRERKLRIENNLTMDELSIKLNVSKSRINMWENNGSVPRISVLIQLSSLYNVSIDYLLGNTLHEEKQPGNPRLLRIIQGLENLGEKNLIKAEIILETIFENEFKRAAKKN